MTHCGGDNRRVVSNQHFTRLRDWFGHRFEHQNIGSTLAAGDDGFHGVAADAWAREHGIVHWFCSFGNGSSVGGKTAALDEQPEDDRDFTHEQELGEDGGEAGHDCEEPQEQLS